MDWAHRKYGKIVRVGFNHVSIADERALQTVYGHGNGFLKEWVSQTSKFDFINSNSFTATSMKLLLSGLPGSLTLEIELTTHGNERSSHMPSHQNRSASSSHI